MKKPSKQEKIENALRSLDTIQSAKTDPFFYARLRVKMENGSQTTSFKWSGQWSWSIAAMILMLILNLFSVYNMWQPDNNPTIVEDNYLDTMAEEYNLEITSIYQEIE